jgi:hypothetical protein
MVHQHRLELFLPRQLHVHKEPELGQELDQQRHVLHGVGTSLEELTSVVARLLCCLTYPHRGNSARSALAGQGAAAAAAAHFALLCQCSHLLRLPPRARALASTLGCPETSFFSRFSRKRQGSYQALSRKRQGKSPEPFFCRPLIRGGYRNDIFKIKSLAY